MSSDISINIGALIDAEQVFLEHDSTLSDALTLVTTGGQTTVLVMDPGRQPLGVVTQATLLAAWQRGLPVTASVVEAMTSDFLVLTEGLDPRNAWTRCQAESSLPLVVMDLAGKAMGVLAADALLKALCEAPSRLLTECQKKEVSLAEQEANFRNFFNTISDFLFILDGQGRVLHANAAAVERLGYRHDELIEQPVLLLHPEDRQEEAARIVAEMLAGRVDHCPVPLRRRDGGTIPVETRVVAGRWNGQPALFGVSRDLSQLAASEEKFAKAFHLSPVAMAISGLDDGVFLEVNGAFSRVTGYTSDEAIGHSSKSLQLFVHPEQRERMVRQVRALGSAIGVEIQIRHRDGQIHDGLFNAGMICLQDRKVMLTQMLDISARKQAEERLRLAARVFDHAQEGIIICDAAVRIVEVNPVFNRITGFAAAEVLGRNPRFLASGRHGKDFYRDMWQTIDARGYWQGEIWNRHKAGHHYACLMSISRVCDEQGEPTHYIAVFSDITFNKMHQEKLEQLAHFDPLTRLPNRVLLADRMRQAMAYAQRNNQLLAVCYLDLDDFKPINDSHGHDIGDLLLVNMSERLLKILRGQDMIARLGGDEFALLFAGLNAAEDCEPLAARVLKTLAKPVLIDGRRLQITASLGMTLYPADNADADTLLRHADQAMYQAKTTGRNRFHLFAAGADQQARAEN
ncbi:putative diguanylate cyclase YegE [Thiorhodovibrio winogradskyi]|uniref:Diguanylate cyclase YegE n=1 Tax=Thiorhodovibrio winogradskyi TaxID=77007 RepID=A0ABZ0SEQ5_9GAMM|nr:PAS domain S-box protein [Thiorhodovibrio winogradskyi]